MNTQTRSLAPQPEVLDLLKDSQKNCQEVIRLLDGKVAIISTAVTLLLGYAAFLGKWWMGYIPKDSSEWACWEKIMYLSHLFFLAGAGICSGMVFVKSKRVWFANHSSLKKEDFTALFPEWDGVEIPQSFVDDYLRNVAAGRFTDHRSVADEYAIQLRKLGGFVYHKIEAVQQMIPWFRKLYIFIGIETIAVVTCMAWKLFR